MNKKLLCVISAILVALSLCFFASCDGCNGGGKTGELKSSMGATLTGGNFGKNAKLIRYQKLRSFLRRIKIP